MKRTLITYLLLLITVGIYAQKQKFDPQINSKEIKEYISFLASDSLKGRFPGTPGDRAASSYIRDHFRDAGLTLLCENGFQPFEVTTQIKTGKNNTLSFNGSTAIFDRDFRPVNFSSSTRLEAPVIFAGYGFDIMTDSVKWNDYSNIDVHGKWVIILRDSPKPDDLKSIFVKNSDDRSKALLAKDKGAAGVLFVNGKKSSDKDELIPLHFDQSKSNSGIPVISITRELADKILAKVPGKKTIEFLENSMISTLKPVSFDAMVNLKATTDVELIKSTTENVVGMLTGSTDPGEYIVIGAHFDHLGMGGKDSNSRKPDTTGVHNGADDNASGVAGVIELAQYLASLKSGPDRPKKSIIFVSFSGEELGLLGSKYFVANPPVDKKKIKAMINFDMIGRYRPEEKPIMISGTGTASEFDSLLTVHNKTFNLPLKFSAGGQEGSDQASFNLENIPVLFFNTGMHPEYHTPEDKVSLINFEGEKKVLDYAKEVIVDLSSSDYKLVYKEAGEKPQSTGGRFKVTLGIMPDYAADNVTGLRIDDVRKGGPAEKAGIKKGDVIISMDGKSVSNIYDYMSRLKTLDAGKLVKVEVMRDNQKISLSVQL
ncbi:MAG: M28 family peptidase [Bacteroidia bacterium]|nr:M28 family peptidase [Bacteroidia bacterium]